MTKEEFDKHLEEATKIVDSWPTWKQNLLRDSLRPMWDNPRNHHDT